MTQLCYFLNYNFCVGKVATFYS